VFAGGWAVERRWVIWLARIVKAAMAGIVYPLIAGETKET
jgi:aquaporin Z